MTRSGGRHEVSQWATRHAIHTAPHNYFLFPCKTRYASRLGVAGPIESMPGGAWMHCRLCRPRTSWGGKEAESTDAPSSGQRQASSEARSHSDVPLLTCFAGRARTSSRLVSVVGHGQRGQDAWADPGSQSRGVWVGRLSVRSAVGRGQDAGWDARRGGVVEGSRRGPLSTVVPSQSTIRSRARGVAVRVVAGTRIGPVAQGLGHRANKVGC